MFKSYSEPQVLHDSTENMHGVINFCFCKRLFTDELLDLKVRSSLSLRSDCKPGPRFW